MATGGARPAAPPRPVGLFAALLALLLAVGAAYGYTALANRQADRYVRALAARSLPFKAQTLTLQRAALRQTGVLSIYGTSELYCCAANYNAGYFFNTKPTGFVVFDVGYPVTEDLFWAQTFGALGHALRGKRLVVSDSPWFFSPGGIAPAAYAHTFSPEIAQVFAWDAPEPLALRAAVARRMLDYPATLQSMPLLRAGLRALASGTWRGDLTYRLLDPLGRLSAWAAELRDAAKTIHTLDQMVHPRPAVPPRLLRQAIRLATTGARTPWWRRLLGLGPARGGPPALWQLLNRSTSPTPPRLRAFVPTRPRTIDWNSTLRQATRRAAALSASNPFGVLAHQWKTCSDITPVGRPWCERALALYRHGRTNHAAQIYPLPLGWVQGVKACRCWTDLTLELETLRTMHASPLVWLQPIQGALADHTPYSAAARRVVYDRFRAIAHAEGIPATTFQTHDTDPLFINSFGHLSPRGWVYADRLLNRFWHGRLGTLRAELARGGSVDRLFPAALNCPHPQWCQGVDNVRAIPGELSGLPVGLGIAPVAPAVP